MKDFIDERLATEVIDSFDVAVLGGGVAGVAAALAASRRGARTLLLEKMTMLGGLATAGHVVIYLPLCDGFGRQVVGGIGEELFHLSVKYSYGGDWNGWREKGKRFETMFNGPAFALALEELLLSSDVKIMYDTLFVEPVVKNGVCSAVVVENMSGRCAYNCKVLVDASGSAEAFYKADVPCQTGENSLAFWSYCSSGGTGCLARGSSPENHLNLLALGSIDTKQKYHVIQTPYFGDTAEGVNRFLLDSHACALNAVKEDAGLVLASLPSMPQLRTIRHLSGAYCLTERDLGQHFADNIGCTGDWRRPAPVYELPYRSLYTERLSNMLAAGRCISADGDAWQVIRVIPPAAVTGEAAGTAASLIAESGCAAMEVPAEKIRSLLSANGCILDVNQ